MGIIRRLDYELEWDEDLLSQHADTLPNIKSIPLVTNSIYLWPLMRL